MNIKELRGELKNLGLPEEVLSGIKDDQLQGFYDKLKPKEIGFDDFLRDPKQQGEFDRRVSKALETAKKKTEDPQPNTSRTIEVKGDVPEWAKSLLDQNKTLSEKLENLEKGTVVKSKLDQAKSFLSKSKLPENLRESWLTRIDVNSQTPIEDQVKGLNTEYETLVQSISDQKQLGGAPPMGNPPKPGMSKEELKKALV